MSDISSNINIIFYRYYYMKNINFILYKNKYLELYKLNQIKTKAFGKKKTFKLKLFSEIKTR